MMTVAIVAIVVVVVIIRGLWLAQSNHGMFQAISALVEFGARKRGSVFVRVAMGEVAVVAVAQVVAAVAREGKAECLMNHVGGAAFVEVAHLEWYGGCDLRWRMIEASVDWIECGFVLFIVFAAVVVLVVVAAMKFKFVTFL